MADDENPTPFERLGSPVASASPPAGRDGAGGDPPLATRFQAGQSGNPTGGSKASREFRELAKSMAPSALHKLKIIALRGNGMPSVRACEIIIERAFGKAPQPITGENGAPLDLGFGAAAGSLIQAAIRARAAETAIDVTAVPASDPGQPG